MTPERFVQASRYAQEVLRRWRLEPDWLDGDAPLDDADAELESRLRRLRQLGALRIQWREMRGRHDVEQTGRELSALAARLIELALEEAERRVAERHGHPRDDDGDVARMTVLALGKLGGEELNFNSDVDLVYCHAATRPSDGARSLGPGEYFSRVAREVSALMERVTADGRAWIIDTRLRPFGQSGALVWSVDAMEQYFINEGRAWERYAWLKARPVAGDIALGEDLLQRIRPFVFRRYLDYGLFDSLRTLHAEIDQRSRREDLGADIKRGPGGIRELEFLIQSLQLLRGGREPALRRPGFLPALRAARRANLIDADEARAIDRHYRFLRALENRLQVMTGRQTHELPEADEGMSDLAMLMGLNSSEQLETRLRATRKEVRRWFQRRFDERPEADDAPALWPPDDSSAARLEALGFEHPEDAAAGLRRLAERLSRRPLSAEGRRRLDRVMPELLGEIADHPPPDRGFNDLLGLVETIARRSAYLALLHERPQTLMRCVRVFQASARVAEWIIASPQLLDDLLAPDQQPALPLPPSLAPGDVESSLNALGRFRQAGFVRTALGQLDGALNRACARALLTELAEQVLRLAAELFLGPDAPELAIIGYGNLGAAELHYTSDLDLVFLHAEGAAPLRPVQRMINAMQLPLQGGKLYDIDTRLRPNGNAGMLVSSIDSFDDYQHRHAWIWEHQALLRARFVSGSENLRDRFEAIRGDVLTRPRDPAEVAEALVDMRRRQIRQRRESGEKRILGDIQFICEYEMLVHLHGHPDLITVRGTAQQLQTLRQAGALDATVAGTLAEIFDRTAALRDRRFLERDFDPESESGSNSEDADRVAEIWRERFGAGARE